jgi:hypothetical protein
MASTVHGTTTEPYSGRDEYRFSCTPVRNDVYWVACETPGRQPSPQGRCGWVARVLVGGVVLVAAITYGVPFLGPLASVLLCTYTRSPAPSMAVRDRTREHHLLGLGLGGLMAASAVGPFTPLFYRAGMSSSTFWLLIPLCGPDNRIALLVPAAAATGVCLLGLAMARVSRRPWPWVVAAWLAPWAHLVAFSQVPHPFSC